ncbi:MAG: toxin-antitoxin system TumE family protein [Caldilineaceae bacterium]
MNPHRLHVQLQLWLNRQREVIDYSLSLDVGRDGGFLIRGTILLAADRTLHVSEYWANATENVPRKYRYHLQGPDGVFISRWDNAPHHPHVRTFPHHVHHADGHIAEAFVHTLYELIIELREIDKPSTPT